MAKSETDSDSLSTDSPDKNEEAARRALTAPAEDQSKEAPPEEAMERAMTSPAGRRSLEALPEATVKYLSEGRVNDRPLEICEVGLRRNSVSAAPVSAAMIQEWKGAPVYKKTEEETARIKTVIQTSTSLQVMFGHLRGPAIDQVVGAMFSRDVEVGMCVIQQGGDGDYFYIVDSGEYDIFVKRQGTPPEEPPEWVQTASPGSSFGELALMYNVARAATVQCREAGRLWCLDRDCFQMLAISSESIMCKEYESFLQKVDALSSLNAYELGKLSDLLVDEIFDDGEEIVRQGDEGDDRMFFLYEGECAAYVNGEHGEVEVMRYDTPGQFFGEVSLVFSEPRRATVRALGECTCLSLKRQDVNLSIGGLRARFVANIEGYLQYEAIAQVPAAGESAV